MEYRISVIETLQRIITIEADDLTSAISKVQVAYDFEEIVLDASDHIMTQISEDETECSG